MGYEPVSTLSLEAFQVVMSSAVMCSAISAGSSMARNWIMRPLLGVVRPRCIRLLLKRPPPTSSKVVCFGQFLTALREG